jgi:hypothetical protein
MAVGRIGYEPAHGCYQERLGNFCWHLGMKKPCNDLFSHPLADGALT